MKSIAQIEQDHRHADALARNPGILDRAIAWLEDATDPRHPGDAIGAAVVTTLRQWRDCPYDVSVTRSGFLGAIAYVFEYERQARA